MKIKPGYFERLNYTYNPKKMGLGKEKQALFEAYAIASLNNKFKFTKAKVLAVPNDNPPLIEYSYNDYVNYRGKFPHNEMAEYLRGIKRDILKGWERVKNK